MLSNTYLLVFNYYFAISDVSTFRKMTKETYVPDDMTVGFIIGNLLISLRS